MKGLVILPSLPVEILKLSQVDIVIGVFKDFRDVLELGSSKDSRKFPSEFLIVSSNVRGQELGDRSCIEETTIVVFEKLKKQQYFQY